MRVTSQTQAANAIANSQRQTAALAKFQNQLSSGLRVERPSDDPSAFPGLSREKAIARRYEAYTRTMADATATLNAGVSALGEMNLVLTRAKAIAVEGADATVNAPERETLASEMDRLIERALATANQKDDGRAVFGGTATDVTPFRVAATNAQGRPATVVYDGAGENSRALIGPDQTVETRFAGGALFQRSGGDAFAALIGLRDALRAPGANAGTINPWLGAVDAARDAVGEGTAALASGLVTIEAVESRTADLKLVSDVRVGELGGTDYAEAVVRMREQESTLQASLAVSARLFQPSLLDFIR